MKLVELSIRQPITVTVGVILSLLAGLVALNRVPIQMTPTVEDLVIAVTTTWEDASPQEIESEIIQEQEERLQSVTNLRSMTSISQLGQGQIRLEFRTGTSKEVALREVNNKLREVPDYPENVDEPVVEDTDPESRDYIAWVIVATNDPNYDITTLFDYFDIRVKPQFERLPGVSEVNVLGGREREVQIRINPDALAHHGITYTQLETAIRTTNDNYSGGALKDGKLDIRIRALGRFDQVDEVKNTVIKHGRSGPVYIRDVATVKETYKELQGFVRTRGREALAINFQREIGSNVLEVMQGVKAQIREINRPEGMLDAIAQDAGVNGQLRLVQVYDQTTYINQALELVQNNIYLGGVLATITLLLFLRSLRSIGIIAIAIPISIIASMVVLYAMGRTVNVVSLAGMAFAVGMVVDNSIVVLENIYRHLEMGKSTTRAALDGASEVAGAVLASTLTTLIVFVPILLIEEQAGQLFRDIALAICSAVGLSFLAAITIIPSASSLMLKPHKHDSTPKSRSFFARIPQLVSQLFLGLTRSVVLRTLLVVLFVAGTLIGIWAMVPPIDYLPQGNRNIVFGLLISPPGYNLDKLSEVGERIEKRIQPFWEAAEDIFKFGERSDSSTPGSQSHHSKKQKVENLPSVPIEMGPDAPHVTPPPVLNYFLVSREGRMFHGGISEKPERALDLIPLFNHATAPDITPGFISFAVQLPLFRLGGTTGTAVNIDLVGSNLDQVSAAAEALYGQLVGQFGPQSIQPEPQNFNLPTPELQVYPDLIDLSEVGLNVRDVGLAVQASSDGAFIGEYDMIDERVDLTLITQQASESNKLKTLGNVSLSTPDGRVVRLDSVAHLARVNEPDQIKRVGRQRAVTLQFTPPRGTPLQDAIDQAQASIQTLRQSGSIPPNVNVQMAGSASKLDAMKTALLGDGTWAGLLTSSLFLSLLVVYLLMCVLFQSWLYPLVIMLSVPLATLGGFLALGGVHQWSVIDRYLPVQNMDVLTILGFIILAGIVVNNAILIVHQTLNFLSGRSTYTDEGAHTHHHAIAQAVESRVRPIMMSTLTSVGGMLPLVLMPGSGSELYRGLGSVVVGGLLVSTLFTLILIPIVLSLVFDIQKALGVQFEHKRGEREDLFD